MHCCYMYTESPRSKVRLPMAGALARGPVPTVAAVVAPLDAVRANGSVVREAAVELQRAASCDTKLLSLGRCTVAR